LRLLPSQLSHHPKFTEVEKTPLAIEVVENPPPGAYDLKFTK
jgi:hypothetical protein